MNKSRIEWTDYTVNPVKGLCPMDCKDLEGKSYCYARRMYKRFHWDETIRYDLDWSVPISKCKEPSRIFVSSTMELFGSWIQPEFVESIIRHIGAWYPQHTFIFLTKRPHELAKYNPWPENCWVGTSAESLEHIRKRGGYGSWAIDTQAKVKFISFEPLLGPFLPTHIPDGVNWVIIGQQTPIQKKHMIPDYWVLDIVDQARMAGLSVFMKNNLKPLLGNNLRQEWPQVQ